MVYQILVVCTGNICRSPMGEIVLREKFAHLGITETSSGSDSGVAVRVRSAGVSDEEHGHGIDRRARRVLDEAGYRKNRIGVAHRVTVEELEGSDLILAMTASHQAALVRMADALGVDSSKIHMWRDSNVPDPWYGDFSGFYDTLDAIERGADRIVEQFTTEHAIYD